MSETVDETPICDICGAEVREGSQFCYNCGGSVSKPEGLSETLVAIPKPEASSDTVQGTSAKFEKARRRNVRAANRQPVELVWQQGSGVGLPFLIGALVLISIAVALFIAANYMH